MGGGSKFWDLFHLDDGRLDGGDESTLDKERDESDATVPAILQTDGSLAAAADAIKGSKLAIDLSQWIVQGETARAEKQPGKHKIYLKAIVHRTVAMCSTRLGRAQPVFVADPSATRLRAHLRVNQLNPSVQTKRGKHFVAKCMKSLKLVELMGCPALVAKGEAEQLCAQLNRAGLVDACVSQDGDCLCFGAKRVFKVFSPCQQADGWPMEYVDSDDVQKRLGLGREQLIAAMLLLG